MMSLPVKNPKDGTVASRERKGENPSRNPWKSPASFSHPPTSSAARRGQARGQGRKGSGVMSRWRRALGSPLLLFGASGVGGQQREAQEKEQETKFWEETFIT